MNVILLINLLITIKIWYNRLSHLNAKYITNVKEYVDSDVDNMNNLRFDVCDISKITRKHHLNIAINQNSEILQLLQRIRIC